MAAAPQTRQASAALLAPLGFALALFLAGWSLSRAQALRGDWQPPANEGALKLDPGPARIAAAGHLYTLVDWLWLEVLQEASIQHVPAGTHPRIYYQLELITDLDPAFMESYTNGATLLAVVRNDGPGAQALLDKGIRFERERLDEFPPLMREAYWGRAWQLHLYQGYVSIFELHDLPRGAEALKAAAEMPGAPVYLKSLKQRLDAIDGPYEVAERLLKFMHDATPDERQRARYREQRDGLALALFMRRLQREFDAWPGRRRGPAAAAFDAFLRARGRDARDPQGGRLDVDESGRIVTSTPREKVFGLE